MIVYCQICRQPIARTEESRLSLPLTGAMFDSYDPGHGFPAPFQPTCDWEFLKCPYCKFRPMTDENKVLVDVRKDVFHEVGAEFVDNRTAHKGVVLKDVIIPMNYGEGAPTEVRSVEVYEFGCQHCGKDCKTKGGKTMHEKTCKSKPAEDAKA